MVTATTDSVVVNVRYIVERCMDDVGEKQRPSWMLDFDSDASQVCCS